VSDVLPGTARARRSPRDLVLLSELLVGLLLGVTRPWQGDAPLAPSRVPGSRPAPATLRTPAPAPPPSTRAPQVTHRPVDPFSPR